MKRFLALLLALACCLSAVGCASGKDALQLAAPVYPKNAAVPGASALAGGLDSFFARSVPALLSGAGEENRVYSPVNVYMALAMLAEITAGDSRREILGLLGSDDIEGLRTQAKSVWNACYRDDDSATCILADSLWLNESVQFKQETVNTLAENYYAAAYRGEMGSETLDAALRRWLSEQTGGLLEAQAAGVETDPLTVIMLASAIYFRARWSAQFSESATAPGMFRAPGGEIECDFMHSSAASSYYRGEGFSAAAKSMNQGKMWFLLPDEGVTPAELLSGGEALELLLSGGQDWEDQKTVILNLSLPKFDVGSETDLRPALKALGVSEVFDPETSDFSPLTDDGTECSLSSASHAARVVVDEEGVIAAAYTVMAATGAAMPPQEELDFTVDRPFVFAVTGADNLPLFVGVVNRPA